MASMSFVMSFVYLSFIFRPFKQPGASIEGADTMPLFFQRIGQRPHELYGVALFARTPEKNNNFHCKASLPVITRFIICIISGSGQEQHGYDDE
jgi:hypothetical protein